VKFISYAQNFEDVMLWRALQAVPNGFYIDVGAWSPDIESVTRAFYHRNWCGINIEPSPLWHAQLVQRRPRDINLGVALSDQPGEVEMFVVGNTGRLSTADKEFANLHAKTGMAVLTEKRQCLTLDLVWDEYVKDRVVQFLKIDVEGFERLVLLGNDWSRHRPWVVLIESTIPNQPIQVYEQWEPILMQARYKFAYADGLNRFYVAEEHTELLGAFALPPNVFDNFVRADLVHAETVLVETKKQLEQERTLRTKTEARLAELEVLLATGSTRQS